MENLRVEYRPLGDLRPYERNARRHSDAQIEKLVGSLIRFGWTRPLLVSNEGELVVGHGVLEAAQRVHARGLVIPRHQDTSTAPCVPLSGLTAEQRREYVLADNALSLLSDWDVKLLTAELSDLSGLGCDLESLGFQGATLADLLGNVAAPQGGGRHEAGDDQDPDSDAPTQEAGQDRSSVLRRLDVTIDEPRHEVKPGDLWRLGGRHVLLCASVVDSWPVWLPHLDDEAAAFCPFAGPFVALATKAAERKLVMVQPDPYIAGHLLDRYADVHGEGAVVLEVRS